VTEARDLLAAELIAFLNGAGPLEGRYFGDPDELGHAFWWRKHLAALSLTPSDPWMEIGSAPRDGTDILLFTPDAREPKILIGFWAEFEDDTGAIVASEWSDTWAERALDVGPTHWLHLPPPPVSRIEGVENER
jgi:hypothetical protein